MRKQQCPVLIPQDIAEEGKQYLRERGYAICPGTGIAADTLKREIADCELEGKTLGLIGLGRIGRAAAKKATYGLDMRVIAYDPYVSRGDGAPPVELVRDRDEVFRRDDFVSLHLPATPETRRMVSERELSLMKPGAYLINAARGEIVDEAALVEALRQGVIAGAGLDVYADEPPRPENPLFRMENVIGTQHNAALTREATARMALHAAIGIDEVLSGKQPSWPVNAPVLTEGRRKESGFDTRESN